MNSMQLAEMYAILLNLAQDCFSIKEVEVEAVAKARGEADAMRTPDDFLAYALPACEEAGAKKERAIRGALSAMEKKFQITFNPERA